MQQDNNRNRVYLFLLLVGILILNVGYASIMFQLTRSDIEKFDDLISEIGGSEIEATKEVYVATKKGMRRFIIESDNVIHFFQKSIGFLALVNIVFVIVMVLLFLFRVNKND